MPFVQHHTPGTSAAAGTTVAATLAADVPAGNLLVVMASFDNVTNATLPTVSSVSKPGGESATWAQIASHNSSSATGAAGVRGEMWAIRTTQQWTSGTTLTVTLSNSVTAKAVVCSEFAGWVVTLRGTAGTGTNASGAPSATTSGTAPAVGDLVLGGASFESSTGVTGDSDTTNGTWQTANSIVGGSGGSAARAQACLQYKIQITTSSQQTYNPTASSDSGACVVALTPDPNATVTPSTIAAAASVPSATLAAGSGVTAPTVTAVAAVPSASVVAGGGPQVKDVQTNTTGGSACSITTTAGESLTGRLVVTFHGSDFYAASGMVAPTGDLTGWQQLALGDLGTNNSHIKAWATTIDSGGAKTVTVVPVNDEECWNVTVVISNAGDIGDIIAAGGTVLDTVAHTPPSLSAVPDNSLWLGAVLSQTFALVNYTVTGTMVDLGEIDNVGTLNAASDDIATGGTISGREFTGDVAVDCSAVALAVPAPSAGGDDATVTPAAVAGLAAVPAATSAAGSTVTPNAVSAIAAIPARTLSAGSTVAPAAVAATSTVPAATLSAGAAVTPAVVAAAATIPAPSVSAGGAVTATPTTVTAAANVGLPALQASSTVTASTVAAVAAVPAASVHISAVITLTTVAGVAAIATPTVTTLGGATATPATVMALASVPAPEVNPADQGSFVSTTTTPKFIAITAGPAFTATTVAPAFASTSAGGDV